MRRKSLLSVAVVGLVLVATGGQAQAHVTVSATDAVRAGSDAIISFRVPTESETASTVEIVVSMPEDAPLASLEVKKLSGWSSTVTTKKLSTPIQTDDGDITEAVSQVDWKANTPGDAIAPGEFGQFDVIVGQLPDAASLTFKAVQTYSDKSVVRWIDVAAPGSTAELEHPAPVLQLSAKGASAEPSAGAGGITANVAYDGASKSSVRVALGVAIAGVVIGALGLALAWSRRRRPAAGSD